MFWVFWGQGQPHNNKYIPLIVFCNHFSLSPSFCSPFSFLSPSSCPHYLSLVYSITFPPVRMPSCLLVLIFIYRFSSFSLPFLCTDGTLELASHSASYLTSYTSKYLPYSLVILSSDIISDIPGGCDKERALAANHPQAIKVILLPASQKGSWYGSRELSAKRNYHGV